MTSRVTPGLDESIMGLPQDSQIRHMEEVNKDLPYPAKTKTVAAEINGVKTDVMSISFSDKIMVTIIQDGRLAQWITVPLLNENPTQSDISLLSNDDAEDGLLPLSRLTPRTLLGAGGSNREIMGQVYASQIASAMITKNSDETRPLLLGLGLSKVEMDRDVFLQIIDLVLQCI